MLAIGCHVSGGRVAFQFFPSPEGETVNARIVMAAGTPAPMWKRCWRRSMPHSEQCGEPSLPPMAKSSSARRFAQIGVAGTVRGMNAAQIAVQLEPSEVRTVRTRDLIACLARTCATIPGVETLTIQERRGGPPGRDLDVRLSGRTLQKC
jgi:hypothetical protein